MNPILSSLLGGGVGELLSGVGDAAGKIRKAITGKLSADEQAAFDQQLITLEVSAANAQAAINRQEAKHPNVFVSGWRPFIGWVCGASLLYKFVLFDLLTWAAAIWEFAQPPQLEMEGLMTVVMALLGLGFSRTYEKIRGIQGRH